MNNQLHHHPVRKERYITKPPQEDEDEDQIPNEHFRLKNVRTKAVAIVDKGAVPKSYWRLIKRKGEAMPELDDTIKSLEEKVSALNLLFESIDQDRVTKDDILTLQEELESKLEAKLTELEELRANATHQEDNTSSDEEDISESEGSGSFSEEEYGAISEALAAIGEIQEEMNGSTNDNNSSNGNKDESTTTDEGLDNQDDDAYEDVQDTNQDVDMDSEDYNELIEMIGEFTELVAQI